MTEEDIRKYIQEEIAKAMSNVNTNSIVYNKRQSLERFDRDFDKRKDEILSDNDSLIEFDKLAHMIAVLKASGFDMYVESKENLKKDVEDRCNEIKEVLRNYVENYETYSKNNCISTWADEDGR